MTNEDLGEVSEDRGFKALFTSYPMETLEVFAPEVLAAHGGRPQQVEALSQEAPLPDLKDPSRFLDIALKATWADGSEEIVVLIEHWSAGRKVDLRRVNWYVADLGLKHPNAGIDSVILVTEPDLPPVSGYYAMTVAGRITQSLDAKVVQLSEADLPLLRALQNRVAAVLMVLTIRDHIEAVLTAFEALIQAPGPDDDRRRFLPFLLKLARLTPVERKFLRQKARARPTMVTFLDEMIEEAEAKAKAEGEAKGKAEGKAEGEVIGKAKGLIGAIRHAVSRGRMSVDIARAEIEDLILAGEIPADLGQEALNLIG